jgi:hypothetical protein
MFGRACPRAGTRFLCADRKAGSATAGASEGAGIAPHGRLDPALTLDAAVVTRTKPLGMERMARKLRDALHRGDAGLRNAVWLMRPMLSPALVALNRDAFVIREQCEMTVDLAGRDAASSLEDVDLASSTANPRRPCRIAFLLKP